MEENMQHCWHTMLYYFKKGKKGNWNAKKDLCSVQRRVEVDSDQIETLIENNDSKYPNQ